MRVVVLILIWSVGAGAAPLERNEYTRRNASDVVFQRALHKPFKRHASDVPGYGGGFITYTSLHDRCSFTYYVDALGYVRDIEASGTNCFGEGQ